MVKNTHGGSGHKKFGRKFTVAPKAGNRLRVSEDEGELYAVVTAMLGNNMFHCHCIDGVLRLGHIRGKFTGRGRRDNTIVPGSWVLIGLREWDGSADKEETTSSVISSGKRKLPKCDLLEVYTDSDKDKLKTNDFQNWSELIINDKTNKEIADNNSIQFATEEDEEIAKLTEQIKSENNNKITLDAVQEDEEINFDEI